MPWWTEVRGISEYPNESSRAAVSIADDGEPVIGFSRRTTSIACVEVPAIAYLLWPQPLLFGEGGGWLVGLPSGQLVLAEVDHDSASAHRPRHPASELTKRLGAMIVPPLGQCSIIQTG
jgi:hypothetical protein